MKVYTQEEIKDYYTYTEMTIISSDYAEFIHEHSEVEIYRIYDDDTEGLVEPGDTFPPTSLYGVERTAKNIAEILTLLLKCVP